MLFSSAVLIRRGVIKWLDRHLVASQGQPITVLFGAHGRALEEFEIETVNGRGNRKNMD